MVAQLREPVRRPEPLLTPDLPSETQFQAYGYNRGTDDTWVLNECGRDAAALSQRVLLLYVLQFQTRKEIAAEFFMREESVQMIVGGRSYERFTAPIRRRLLALGIGNEQMTRGSKGVRPVEIRRALQSLAAQAYDMLIWPDHYYADQISEVSTDLYLLSGAWREDEQ